MTKIIKVEQDMSVLREAAQALREGKLVALPTETVYGLGASAFCEEAVHNTFKAKGRPQDNPLIVHVSDREMLSLVVKQIPPEAELLMKHFWPGPLTMIMEKADCISHTVTAGLDTVAVRMPSHPVARALIEMSGVPVTAPSANLSGSPSTTRAEHVIADLTGRVDYIIDGGASEVGLESTVLDLTGEVPQILRPGGISLKQLQTYLPQTTYEPALKGENTTPKSPGMKYRHYAPQADLFLVEGDFVKKVEPRLEEAKKSGRRVGLLCQNRQELAADFHIAIGATLEDYARNLFDSLRKMDELGADIIFAQLPAEDDGIAAALKNRLRKAAGGHVL
ncbi:MAG: threonylcarbamoyl-AMP synthase [Ruminococcaceae bacterium]|nr:threonylcarbamoyl-AMP synthase [Oscillospiraceae bacterium]